MGNLYTGDRQKWFVDFRTGKTVSYTSTLDFNTHFNLSYHWLDGYYQEFLKAQGKFKEVATEETVKRDFL